MFQFLDPGPLCDDDLTLLPTKHYPADEAGKLVPAYRFKMQHTHSGMSMGEIELRIGNTRHVLMYAGHIGYEVYPPFRHHHYAARCVQLLLPLARRHGLFTLWITCNPDNYASRRTCELAGFELVEIVNLPSDLDMYREGERRKCRYRRVLE
jgi:tagatose 1,6-diphosphate aldolase